jgi:hypothetical protein
LRYNALDGAVMAGNAASILPMKAVCGCGDRSHGVESQGAIGGGVPGDPSAGFLPRYLRGLFRYRRSSSGGEYHASLRPFSIDGPVIVFPAELFGEVFHETHTDSAASALRMGSRLGADTVVAHDQRR